MSIEILPLGQKCQLACDYCYENEMREAGNEGGEGYDVDAILRSAEEAGVGRPDGRGGVTGATGFGGEFLLTPLKDIEKIVEHCAALGAPFSLQTNGALITTHHVDLFVKHRVSVGVSIDGPEELNDTRKVKGGTLEHTRKATANTERNIDLLLRVGISVSLIVTVYATNAGTDERLERLIAWLLGLRDKGVRYLNLHTLEPGHGPDSLNMTQDRQTVVMRRLKRELTGFAHVSPFADMKAKLLQDGQASCTWNFCSPYSTPAVTGIDGQGNKARCGRLNNDGVAAERSSTHGHERYLALYLTPMEDGGCGGCRFFLSCGGGNCPGEAEGGDWRNKTVHCKTLTALFKDTEQELFAEGKEPISMSLRRPLLEYQKLAEWAGLPSGTVFATPVGHADIQHGDKQHGDHTDHVKPVIEHGDHTDHSASARLQGVRR